MEKDNEFEVINEIRRCLNFFKDETNTSMYLEFINNDTAYIIDEETKNKYLITIKEIKKGDKKYDMERNNEID